MIIDHEHLKSIYVKTDESEDLFPTTDIYPTHWSENKPWDSIDAITTERKSGTLPRHLLNFTPLCDASSKFFRLTNCEIRLTKSQIKRYNPTGILSVKDARDLLIKDFHAADGYLLRIRNHWRDLVSNLSKVCYYSDSEDKWCLVCNKPFSSSHWRHEPENCDLMKDILLIIHDEKVSSYLTSFLHAAILYDKSVSSVADSITGITGPLNLPIIMSIFSTAKLTAEVIKFNRENSESSSQTETTIRALEILNSDV